MVKASKTSAHFACQGKPVLRRQVKTRVLARPVTENHGSGGSNAKRDDNELR